MSTKNKPSLQNIDVKDRPLLVSEWQLKQFYRGVEDATYVNNDQLSSEQPVQPERITPSPIYKVIKEEEITVQTTYELL